MLGIYRGAIIGAISGGIANWFTLGTIQPINIIIGLIAGGIIGLLLP